MKTTLRHLLESSAIFKISGFVLVWIALIALFYAASVSPRSLVRRSAVDYVAWLDASFRSMLKPRRGAFLALSQLCGAISFAVLGISLESRAALAGVVAALVVPPAVVHYLVRRRLRLLAPQVHGFALALASSLKTTASIGEAIWVTVTLTSAPLREEIEIALKETKVGSSLEDALLAMSARAQSTSLDAVVSALLIGRQTGGDLPRILETTSASLRDLQRLEEMQAAVSRGARVAILIAALTTLAMAGFVLSMPQMGQQLLHRVKGQLALLQCALAWVIAIVIGYRVTRPDV